jgi:hypothetical protein
MRTSSMPFRCGACQKELRMIWAVLRAKPFPICTKCRLMVHHGCLSQAEPPVCRRCAKGIENRSLNGAGSTGRPDTETGVC